MLHRKLSSHRGHIVASLFALVIAVFLTSCGSGSVPASSGDAASAQEPETGEGAQLPLVIDGDRLGVSSLDGNPPTPVSGPGYVNGVAYDAEGALLYVQHSGEEPGFYRVEDGVPRLVIPLPRMDPSSAAKWSPDASMAAWIESDGEASELVLAKPGEEPRRVEVAGISDFLWSHDGKQILAWEGWEGTNIYMVNFETGEVNPTALKGLPVAWAPSRDIVVSRETGEARECVRQFAVAHPDGTGTSVLGKIVLCTEGTPSSMSALSPDGKWFAWGRAENAQGQRENLVAVAATDGSATAALKCDADCSLSSSGYGPVWSSDGEQIAWNQDGHILLADTGAWEGRAVGEGYVISWSPNNSAIAYVQRQGDTNAIFELSLEDGEQTKVVDLTPFSGPHVQVAWSPDGRQLAVPLPTSKKSDLFSFDLQTGDLQRLPVAVEYHSGGFLAPDGSAVVLYTEDGWTVYGLDGSSRTIRENASGDMCTDWSPDASRSLCAGRSGLYTLETSTNDVEWLLESSTGSARWSPDESAVAFAQGSGKHRLSVLNTVTGEVQELATDLQGGPAGYFYGNGSYAWSPDGKWIAFTNWRSGGSAPCYDGFSSISVIGADGENLRQLADSPGYKRDLVFSPDGRYLAYTDSTGLVAVDVATGEETTVAATAWDATIWVDASSLLVHDPLGVRIIGIDGSAQLILARTSGCGQGVIGWHEGKLFFSNSCSHQGY